MVKNITSLLIVLLSSISIQAQNKCGTTEVYDYYKQQYPEIETYDMQLTEEYHSAFQMSLGNRLARKTADDIIYHIPVVVHIIHNYGQEYISDDSVYSMIAKLNQVYALRNDTSMVIQPFKKYVGKANIQFHLASRDPLGNPTKGITRHYSYLTYGGDQQAKMDLWPPTSYFNIWIENVIGRSTGNGITLAYSSFPSMGATVPYYDGVIAGYRYVNENSIEPMTMSHETGHYFNLLHVWNNNGPGQGVCGAACGDDEVDDTPPTTGHCSSCDVYDTSCTAGYFKIYPSITYRGFDSLANYPDTANVQNIMNYSTCKYMFTQQQVLRMRAALNSVVGGRNILWSGTNLKATGAMQKVDLPPIPAFSVNNRFICQNISVTFTNRSWNDTIADVQWIFPEYVLIKSSASKTNVSNKFSKPGWVTVSVRATGNGTGTVTMTDPQGVFVADVEHPTQAMGYMQEFNEGKDLEQWPLFNYYNNNFKWKLRNDVGYYDRTCLMYTGFDDRSFPDNVTGTPKGDFDDMFTPPFDLTGYNGICRLNYMYSGATRTSASVDMNDTLEIAYNNDCGTATNSWKVLATLTKAGIDNTGTLGTAFEPIYQGQWALQSIDIPQAARTATTIFRFRYKPSVNQKGLASDAMSMSSTGNNFYIDRINISAFPLGVNTLFKGNSDLVIAPNPTNGDAYILFKNAMGIVDIQVTDITGKVVYALQQRIEAIATRVDIPQTVLATKGIYLVSVRSGNNVFTDKLVVY